MTQGIQEDQLSAYLDHELSEGETLALERALARDPSLRARLEDLRRVSVFLGRHGPTVAPTGFEEQVLGRVEVERTRPDAWRPLGVPVTAWAVAAAALAVLWLARAPAPSHDEPSSPAAPASEGAAGEVEGSGRGGAREPLLGVGHAYWLQVDGPEVLTELERIAARLGGTVEGPPGETALRPGEPRALVVRLPGDALARFAGELEAIPGATVRVEGDRRLVSGGIVPVQVTVDVRVPRVE